MPRTTFSRSWQNFDAKGRGVSLEPSRSRPMWRVTISEHNIPSRWQVPEQQIVLGAPTAELATSTVIQMAHKQAKIPPLHSMLTLSTPYAYAIREANPAHV
jgi:predicted oxidoreductase (fatty acid repression mutant protein)